MTAKLRKKAEALRLDRAATGLGSRAWPLRLSRGHQVYPSPPPVRLCGRHRQRDDLLDHPPTRGEIGGRQMLPDSRCSLAVKTELRWIKPLTTAVVLGPAVVIATLCAAALGAEQGEITLSPKAVEEIAQVEAEIDRIEAETLKRLAPPPDNQVQQVELLGKLLLYDKHLSVHRNEACAFCHMPDTGFTGPSSELNRTTGSYPGSVRTR